MLPNKEKLDLEEELLRKEIASLPHEQKAEFYRDLEKQTRDPDTYAVLAWLAFAGLQHFYLRNWLKGMGTSCLFILAITFFITGQKLWGISLFILIAAAEAYYLFGSQRLVQEYNNLTTSSVLEHYKNPTLKNQ